MKKAWSVLPALAGALLLLVSCYPGEVTSIQQLDVVITAHDDTVTFTSFATYALLDSVVHIDPDSLADPDAPIATEDSLLSRDNDALILAQIRAGIEGMGYVEELNPATNTPDIFLLVGAWAASNTAYFSYGWWPYYGWYPYYPCCYGGGWGWGYPSGGSVSYDTGTLVITMLDPTRPGPLDERLAPVLWVAGMNGLLSGTNQEARIITLIDQAFDQSPYLSAN